MAVLALGLAACTTTAASTDPFSRFSAALEGAYSNTRQYAEADESLRRPPAAGHPYDWIDHQHATFHRVTAPEIGSHIVYLEWRSGGPNGPISRQRLWSFRTDETGEPRMDFYTFVDPAPYAGRGGEPGAFASVQSSDLIGYGEACALEVEPVANGQFAALIPETCVITARSGRRMRLEAVVMLAGPMLSYREQGVLDDGTIAFKVPGGPPYLFDRLP